MDLADRIDAIFADGAKGLTIWPSLEHGYQANIQNRDGSWRVMTGRTPSAALSRTLDTYTSAALSHTNAPTKLRQRDDEDLI